MTTMDRREVLKNELLTLDSEEIFVIRSYAKKREKIYEELRKLDSQQVNQDRFIRRENIKPNKKEASKRNKEMYKVVYDIIENNPDGIYSKDIKKILKEDYGFRPSNMSQFMNNFRLKYPEIQKPFSGFYKMNA
ncbi:hypothetical protein G3M81_22830 [Bacillus paralicheniformis]|uniref:Rok-like winged helix domain-containing protein n=1 Tax=Bacillus TaxID=1386 RepID=UPI0013EED417|nr:MULTISPECIES: hypothetical protein [Bacillus]QII26928.1 hypothetical protein G3M80_20740 [Bacillus altitudinis]QII51396.1 hypothetical protein G3M81_22830 [Bacillus paralicheniformis]